MSFEYKQCKICNKWGYVDTHKCPPIWQTYCLWGNETPDEEEWNEYYARYPDEAAELAGEAYDSEEYHLLSGSELEVLVRNPETKEIQKYTVTGESVPKYYAQLSIN